MTGDVQINRRESMADMLASCDISGAYHGALEAAGIDVVTHTLEAGNGYAAWRHEYRSSEGQLLSISDVEREKEIINGFYKPVCERAARKMRAVQSNLKIAHPDRNFIAYTMIRVGCDYRNRLLGRFYRRLNRRRVG